MFALCIAFRPPLVITGKHQVLAGPVIERGRDRGAAVGRKAVAHIAQMRGQPVDRLEDDDATLGRAVGVRPS